MTSGPEPLTWTVKRVDWNGFGAAAVTAAARRGASSTGDNATAPVREAIAAAARKVL
jgi:hypothetical protein